MRKSLISVGHAVRILFLLNSVAAIICRVENLSRKTICHRLFAASARVGNNPTNSQGTAPLLVNFNRNLIRRTADAPRLHFNRRLDVVAPNAWR